MSETVRCAPSGAQLRRASHTSRLHLEIQFASLRTTGSRRYGQAPLEFRPPLRRPVTSGWFRGCHDPSRVATPLIAHPSSSKPGAPGTPPFSTRHRGIRMPKAFAHGPRPGCWTGAGSAAWSRHRSRLPHQDPAPPTRWTIGASALADQCDHAQGWGGRIRGCPRVPFIHSLGEETPMRASSGPHPAFPGADTFQAIAPLLDLRGTALNSPEGPLLADHLILLDGIYRICRRRRAEACPDDPGDRRRLCRAVSRRMAKPAASSI